MKKVFAVFIIMTCFTAFSLEVFARAQPPVKSAKMERFTGRVTSVNASDMTMVVESKSSGMTFDIGEAKLKGCSSIQGIKEGDSVTVQYVMKEGKAIARTVSKNRSYRR